MKKFVLNWAGRALFVLAIGAVAGVFLSGPISGRIGSGVIAVLAAAGAWRCWNVASGHTAAKRTRAGR